MRYGPSFDTSTFREGDCGIQIFPMPFGMRHRWRRGVCIKVASKEFPMERRRCSLGNRIGDCCRSGASLGLSGSILLVGRCAASTEALSSKRLRAEGLRAQLHGISLTSALSPPCCLAKAQRCRSNNRSLLPRRLSSTEQSLLSSHVTVADTSCFLS